MDLHSALREAWRSSHPTEDAPATIADSTLRMRQLALLCTACLGLVFARLALLECTQGAAFRSAAARPLEKARALPGVRGRILSRDGELLAVDSRVASLAVHYRYIEDPPSPRWLRNQARARVPRDVSDRAARLAAEQAWIRDYRAGLLGNLAQLCGRPRSELARESADIQARVRAISTTVNAARRARPADVAPSPDVVAALMSWDRLGEALPQWLFASDAPRNPPHIVVAEELDYHVLVPDVPLEVVAEIESRPELYPGVRIVEQSRRRYPHGMLAANLVGHLGLADAVDQKGARDASQAITGGEQVDGGPVEPPPRNQLVGRLGAERQCENQLRGHEGRSIDQTDHSGRLLASLVRTPPRAGKDVALTIDSRLQRIAEEQLDRALAREQRATGARAGGAIAVLDIRTGAILAAASAPRFDPNLFATREAAAVDRILSDPSHPLFDRVTKMALTPGSVFKIVTAAALLAEPHFDPRERYECQGFLAQPDRLRCAIFRRYGLGHGAVDLSDALVTSCNVFFFHHAEELGPARLADYGARFGFGCPTGVDLPDEAAGFLPTPAAPGGAIKQWELVDTQAMAIGQSTLTATPLQIARLVAAIGNGGRMVTPHVIERIDGVPQHADTLASSSDSDGDGTPVPGLTQRHLDEIRHALVRVTSDPQGTAYAALADCSVVVAGKTGTAETGAQSPDHAWFAGYAPADNPQVALAVALEHQGAAEHAAAVVKEVVEGAAALGLLSPSERVDVAADSWRSAN